MRTTVCLDGALLERARAEAARRNTTLTRLIEQGLLLVVSRTCGEGPVERVDIPVSRASGGTFAGVDLGNSAALPDWMDRAP